MLSPAQPGCSRAQEHQGRIRHPTAMLSFGSGRGSWAYSRGVELQIFRTNSLDRRDNVKAGLCRPPPARFSIPYRAPVTAHQDCLISSDHAVALPFARQGVRRQTPERGGGEETQELVVAARDAGRVTHEA
jgi:hypothetical protein